MIVKRVHSVEAKIWKLQLNMNLMDTTDIAVKTADVSSEISTKTEQGSETASTLAP